MADRVLPFTSGSYTYADPYLSLWQSAALEVRTQESLLVSGERADLMAPVHTVYGIATQGLESASELLDLEAEPEGVVQDCAKLASKFLWAEITGNGTKAQFYADQLKKAVCDAGGWSTCLTAYLKFKAEGGNWPYRANIDSVFPLKGPSVALIGDWGTGEHAASHLLDEIKKRSPDVLIHLGDIYYSGTQSEASAHFLEICRNSLGNNIPIYSLCGNHDMYSGGAGYYWLLDQLDQKITLLDPLLPVVSTPLPYPTQRWERIIDEIQQLEEIFEAPDIRPLSASDISAANRKHDEMLAQSPWFRCGQELDDWFRAKADIAIKKFQTARA